MSYITDYNYNKVALKCFQAIITGSYSNANGFTADSKTAKKLGICSDEVRAKMAFDEADAFMNEMKKRNGKI